MKTVTYDIQLEGLFPRPLGITHFHRPLSDNELFFIHNLELKKHKRNNHTSTSIDTYVLQRKEMSDINSFISSCLKNFYQTIYSPKKDVDIYITQSWANFTKPGHTHSRHIHPNSIISGVFYVDVDSKKDTITFYDNKPSGFVLESGGTENATYYNSHGASSIVMNGMLLLFNSSLEHEVRPTISDKTRVSISFNSFIRGSLGSEETLTHLML